MKEKKSEISRFFENHRIIIDTREQIPYFTRELWYRGELVKPNITFDTLSTGDYSIEGYTDSIAIERKSRPDFWQSITRERKRFEREVKRLSEYRVHPVVIEGKFDDCISATLYGRRINPDSISGTVASWAVKYNTSFYFLVARKEAEVFTLQTLFHAVKFFKGGNK